MQSSKGLFGDSRWRKCDDNEEESCSTADWKTLVEWSRLQILSNCKSWERTTSDHCHHRHINDLKHYFTKAELYMSCCWSCWLFLIDWNQNSDENRSVYYSIIGLHQKRSGDTIRSKLTVAFFTPLIKLSVEPTISECLQAVLGKSRHSCRSQSLQNDRSPLPPPLFLSSSSASTSPLPPPLSSSLLLFEVPHPKPALVSQEESNTRWLQSSPENEIFQPVAKMHSSYHLQYYRLNHPIWMEMMFRKWK